MASYRTNSLQNLVLMWRLTHIIVANCPYFRGFENFYTVVPPTDVGYNDHIWKCIDLIIMEMSLHLTHKFHFFYR